jgi:hypothetical protein
MPGLGGTRFIGGRPIEDPDSGRNALSQTDAFNRLVDSNEAPVSGTTQSIGGQKILMSNIAAREQNAANAAKYRGMLMKGNDFAGNSVTFDPMAGPEYQKTLAEQGRAARMQRMDAAIAQSQDPIAADVYKQIRPFVASSEKELDLDDVLKYINQEKENRAKTQAVQDRRTQEIADRDEKRTYDEKTWQTHNKTTSAQELGARVAAAKAQAEILAGRQRRGFGVWDEGEGQPNETAGGAGGYTGEGAQKELTDARNNVRAYQQLRKLKQDLRTNVDTYGRTPVDPAGRQERGNIEAQILMLYKSPAFANLGAALTPSEQDLAERATGAVGNYNVFDPSPRMDKADEIMRNEAIGRLQAHGYTREQAEKALEADPATLGFAGVSKVQNSPAAAKAPGVRKGRPGPDLNRLDAIEGRMNGKKPR